MKNLFKILISGLTVVSFVLFFSCGSDDDGGGGGGDDGNDPNSFCTGGLCSTGPNPDLARAECIDTYNDCVLLGESTDAECKALGLTVCNL